MVVEQENEAGKMSSSTNSLVEESEKVSEISSHKVLPTENQRY